MPAAKRSCRTAGERKPKWYWQSRIKQLKDHKAQPKPNAGSTARAMARVSRIWADFCAEVEEDPDELLFERPTIEQFKSFLEWVIERSFKLPSSPIGHRRTVELYWTYIRMLHQERMGSGLEAEMAKEVRDKYVNQDLTTQYGLETAPKLKSVFSSSDLYRLLHYLWCFDTEGFSFRNLLEPE